MGILEAIGRPEIGTETVFCQEILIPIYEKPKIVWWTPR